MHISHMWRRPLHCHIGRSGACIPLLDRAPPLCYNELNIILAWLHTKLVSPCKFLHFSIKVWYFHIYSLLNQQKIKIIGKNAPKIAQLHKTSLFTSNNTLWKFHMISRYLWCTYITCGDVPCIVTLVVVCMPHIYSMCARETLVKWVGSLVTRSGNYYSYITTIVTY
jgi:hypothetical protein